MPGRSRRGLDTQSLACKSHSIQQHSMVFLRYKVPGLSTEISIESIISFFTSWFKSIPRTNKIAKIEEIVPRTSQAISILVAVKNSSISSARNNSRPEMFPTIPEMIKAADNVRWRGRIPWLRFSISVRHVWFTVAPNLFGYLIGFKKIHDRYEEPTDQPSWSELQASCTQRG